MILFYSIVGLIGLFVVLFLYACLVVSSEETYKTLPTTEQDDLYTKIKEENKDV